MTISLGRLPINKILYVILLSKLYKLEKVSYSLLINIIIISSLYNNKKIIFCFKSSHVWFYFHLLLYNCTALNVFSFPSHRPFFADVQVHNSCARPRWRQRMPGSWQLQNLFLFEGTSTNCGATFYPPPPPSQSTNPSESLGETVSSSPYHHQHLRTRD